MDAHEARGDDPRELSIRTKRRTPMVETMLVLSAIMVALILFDVYVLPHITS